jgi:glycine cleavage system H protein
MQTPHSLLFSPHHLWAKPTENGLWEAGVTDYAQNLLGDIVFVEAPAIGTRLTAEHPCGLVESVKTGSDLHALINGEVVEINQSAIDSPEKINDNPYKTWIFKFKADNDKDAEQLLSADAYEALIKS